MDIQIFGLRAHTIGAQGFKPKSCQQRNGQHRMDEDLDQDRRQKLSVAKLSVL